jgi:hypothetical protein
MKKPPTYKEVLNCNKKIKEEKNQNRGSTTKFEDTFVADLLVFNYELIV